VLFRSVAYPLLVQKPGNPMGLPAGVPQRAWSDNGGIGAAGGIQQFPVPQWQQNVSPGGQTVQAPSPVIGPFNQPIVLGGGTTGTTGTSTGTTVPVVSGPRAGGFNVTNLPPEQVAANQASSQKLNDELQFTGNYNRTNQQNLAALEALRNAPTGAGSTQRNWAKNFVLSVAGPDFAKRLGIDENQINWFDEANKYLTARQAAMSGPMSTDFARHQAELSNPSVEISKNAAIQMHQINSAYDNMRQAAIQTYLKLPQNQGRTLNDPNVSAGFLRYWNNYMNTHDYRAYMPQNKSERFKTVQSLRQDELDNFEHSQADANGIGVRVTP